MANSRIGNSTPQGKEIWRDVPGYEGLYQVSDMGRVKSLRRTIRTRRSNQYSDSYVEVRVLKERLLNPYSKGANYYPRVSLKGKSFRVHRLVAMAFHPNPDGLREVNHKNGVKTDNRAANLEWVSSCENTRHAYRKGLIKDYSERRKPTKRTLLTADDVRAIREAYHSEGVTVKDIHKKWDISLVHASRIVNRKSWAHI